MEKEVIIRQYEEKDRESVRSICARTGFLGKPIDVIFCDRALYADLMISPYLILEPEHAFVAESEKQVVGYRVGALDPLFECKAFPIRSSAALRMAAKGLLRGYKTHARSWQFVRWLLCRSFRERPKRPCTAHGHTSLEAPYRAHKIGSNLVAAFEDLARKNNIREYYREVVVPVSSNLESRVQKQGLVVFDKVETTVYFPELNEKAYLTCFHKKILEFAFGSHENL